MTHLLKVRAVHPATDDLPELVDEWEHTDHHMDATEARRQWLARDRPGASPVTRHPDGSCTYTDANGCTHTLQWTDPAAVQHHLF
ncbi:hypothetical protein [Galactobacter valiniphilus]|uniref:hypothetical protein n=1 Tax=Galactobacter valiniphilus TaxID=2676122 RepID=UPI003734DAFC